MGIGSRPKKAVPPKTYAKLEAVYEKYPGLSASKLATKAGVRKEHACTFKKRISG